MRSSSHLFAVLLFAGTALLILWDMLLPGYILTLDMVWSDSLVLEWGTDGFNNTWPLQALLWLGGLVFPAWVVQKLMLLGLFFGLGYLPYRFLPYLTTQSSRIFAGLLYLLNPFVYTRMLAGQWGVLLGYALLPVVLATMINLVDKPSYRTVLKLVGVLLLVGVCSIHYLYLSVLGVILFSGIYVVRASIMGDEKQVRLLTRMGALATMLFLVVSSYWLVPAGQREVPLEARFDITHFEGFSASENHLVPTLLNLSVLGGFWGEGNQWRYYFVWPQEQPVFWLVAIILGGLVGLGLVVTIRNKRTRFLALVLLGVGIVSYILALGVWGGVFSALNQWFYAHVPWWGGLRDSHKIAGVLSLVYVFFASNGFAVVVSYLKNKIPRYQAFLVPTLFVLPVVFGMYQWGGFHGQLTATQYPDSWYEVSVVLEAGSESEKVLVLPWRGYFSLPVSNQLIIANPASRFFGNARVVAGRSVEVEGVEDQEVASQYIATDAFINKVTELSLSEKIAFLQTRQIQYLLVLVNPAVENQNTWLSQPENRNDGDLEVTEDPREARLVQALLQVPHEVVVDKDVLLYRFGY